MKRADMQALLSATEQAQLLSLAEAAIAAAVQREPLPQLNLEQLSDNLREHGASFVTITHTGGLRGCIGTIERQYPLAQDVVLHAAAAATADPRFSPLKVEELAGISIEISVLSVPEPLAYDDPFELPSLLNASQDGVVLRSGLRRATFLPQVWERVPDAEQFLQLLCLKALLPEDAWKSGQLEFETYRVMSFKR